MDYEDKIEEFKEYLLLEKKYSQNTINSYANELKKFKKYFIDKKSLKNLNNKDIKDYVQSISGGESSKSLAHAISTLKSFYKFLLTQKYVKNNPLDNIVQPKIKKDLPKVLSEEEVERLLDIKLTNH